MANPVQPEEISAHNLIYSHGIFSSDMPFLDVCFSAEDMSVQTYLNRIIPEIVGNVKSHLEISGWHSLLYRVSLHPSYNVLLYSLYDFYYTYRNFLETHLELTSKENT